MSSAQAVLGSPELLDLILQHVPERHLLTACQKVSHFWRAVITRAPIIRQSLFLDSSSSPVCRPVERYRKNDLIAFLVPTLFSLKFTFRHGQWRRRHEIVPRPVIPMRLTSSIRDGQVPDWMAGRPQWDQMHVAQPTITTLRWEVTRADRANRDIPDVLPCALAELRFPRGLRMGELWDLVTAMRGVLELAWPLPKKVVRQHTTYDPPYQWRADSHYAADESHTLIVKQQVTDEDVWVGDVPTGMSVDDYEHPNRYSLYSNLPLHVIFDRHQIPVPKLSLLDDSDFNVMNPIVYTPVDGNEIESLSALAQIPSSV
ncbi:hypothetical protein F4805DRAFT_423876 [Annulohypoxylon moriforme]|nr:hypothetical protein F4805DRAFT_423876 [Annulohypoxylon moriforme]